MEKRQRYERLMHNPYGMYDFYLFYRENSKHDKSYYLTKDQYSRIARALLKEFVNELVEVGYVNTIKKLGHFAINVCPPKKAKYKKDGTLSLPGVSWKETMKLWKEDPQAREEKLLIRKSPEARVFVKFRTLAWFRNIIYIDFRANKPLMKRIFLEVRNGKKYPIIQEANG